VKQSMDMRGLPAAAICLSSRKDLKGATPVPGPIKIKGMEWEAGSLSTPFSTHTGTRQACLSSLAASTSRVVLLLQVLLRSTAAPCALEALAASDAIVSAEASFGVSLTAVWHGQSCNKGCEKV